jgi:EmrB/QacA subfamily drug resistance transporter
MSAVDRVPAAASQVEQPIGHPLAALAVVLLAAFMNQFDVTGVNVAVAPIQRDLSAGAAAGQWVLAGYALPFALLLVTGGRLGDLYGRRRIFLVGVAGFTVASLLAGLAPGAGVLIAARVLQGCAAGLMGPQVLAILQAMVPAAKRGPAMGMYAATLGLSTVAGPILGGALVQADLFGWGWRTIFLVNLPIGVVAMAGGAVLLRESRLPGRRLDVVGVLLAAVMMLLLLYPLTTGPEHGWPPWTWVALAAAAPMLGVFVGHQRARMRAGREPLLALGIFRHRTFVAGAVATALLASLMTGFFFVFVLFLQEGAGYDPARAGRMLLTWALGTALASVLAVPLARRFGRRVLLVGAGLTVPGIALVLAAVVAGGNDPQPGPMRTGLALFGIGVGLVGTPILNVSLAGVRQSEIGAASGAFSTFRQTGAAVGAALTGSVFFGVLAHRPGSYVTAVTAALGVEAAVAVAVLVLVLVLPPAVGSEEAVAG